MRKVTVESQPQPYLLKISTPKHDWLADEPEDKGGLDQGPSPYELLLSSVGACIAITCQMYSKRKGWHLDAIVVELGYSKVRAEECEACETTRGHVGVIDLNISLTGDLSPEQRQRIFEIAGRCPVKKTLEGEIVFTSHLGS